MRRGVTEQYHRHEMTPDRADEKVQEVLQATGFEVKRMIFEGKIYKSDKIGTRIYEGEADVNGSKREAVLKVQFLKPDIEEAELMQRFTQQNGSSNIRVAEIYDHSPYNPQKEYGHIIMERVKGNPIFKGLATDEERETWLKFYEELRTNSLIEPLFPAQWQEQDGRPITALRMSNWLNIARKQGHLDREKVGLSVRHMTQMVLGGVGETAFMHGHLSPDAVLSTENGERVLMSQAFWKYLPLYSDTVFHIWASLKELRGEEIISAEQAIAYIETWRENYKTLPLLARDGEFDKYFASAMRERCVGAMIVDIDSDLRNRGGMTPDDALKLKDMFRGVFNHYSKSTK